MVMKRKRTKKKAKKKSSKPIGYTKQGKSFVLVYGTKTKPRLGRKKFKSKASMIRSV